jgi:ADP-ribose pyrophosphatase YjhB (NUDIX family)
MEISEAYRFCPACGAKRQSLSPPRPFRCSACNHTSFFGPVTAVGTVITNVSGQVLLIERAREPGLGKLGLPGGFVDPNEGAEAAARREIEEELGISVGAMTFLMTAPNSYSYRGVVHPVLDIFFSACVIKDQVVEQDAAEVAAWHWSDLHQGVLDRMAFHSNRLALEHFLASDR